MLSLFLSTTFELDFVFCFGFYEIYTGESLFVFLFVYLEVVPIGVGKFFLYVDFDKGRLPVLSLLLIRLFGRY